jgi:hypothetical protein
LLEEAVEADLLVLRQEEEEPEGTEVQLRESPQEEVLALNLSMQ